MLTAFRLLPTTVVIVASCLTVTAKADCGCQATDRPCTQEIFVTAPATVQSTKQTISEAPVSATFSLKECWGCDAGIEPLSTFILALMIVPILIAAKRTFFQSDKLLIPRFDLLSNGALKLSSV